MVPKRIREYGYEHKYVYRQWLGILWWPYLDKYTVGLRPSIMRGWNDLYNTDSDFQFDR